MRIVIDGGTWDNARGYGRFTRELVGAIGRINHRHDIVLLLPRTVPSVEVASGVRVSILPARESPSVAARADGHRSFRDLWMVRHAIARESPDVVFFPTVYTFVPVAAGPRVAIGIHDVTFDRFPTLIFPEARYRLLWRLKVRLAVRQAARIVAVSAHARDGIIERLGVDPAIIRIVSEAPAAGFRRVDDPGVRAAARRRVGIPAASPLFIYVGGMAPHKNLSMLIEVFTATVRTARFADAKLLLVGDYEDRVFHSEYPSLRARVEADGANAITFTGRLPDSVIASLLSDATALVLPSFDEGFGLPGIEAAACGTAVVATRSSALPEVLGDTALYFDPHSPGELRDALERLLDDPGLSRSLGARALACATALSWDNSARAAVDLFEELAS